MEDKTRKIVITILSILLIGFLLYYFLVVRRRKVTNESGETCSDGSPVPSSGDCADIVPPYNSGSVETPPKPSVNGCIKPEKYVSNFFPLTIGMKGSDVIVLQKLLNSFFKSGLKEDGYFGCNTQAELIKRTGKNNISKQEMESLSTKTISINPFLG